MAILIPGTIDRPTTRTPAVQAAAIEAILKDVIEWLGDDYRPAEDAELRKQIADAVEFHRDGYEIARELERDGWSPDFALAEILDCYTGILSSAERDALKKWVAETEPKPAFKRGDKVKSKWGGKPVEGVVLSVGHSTAQYGLRLPPSVCAAGCALCNWEDTEAV